MGSILVFGRRWRVCGGGGVGETITINKPPGNETNDGGIEKAGRGVADADRLCPLPTAYMFARHAAFRPGTTFGFPLPFARKPSR